MVAAWLLRIPSRRRTGRHFRIDLRRVCVAVGVRHDHFYTPPPPAPRSPPPRAIVDGEITTEKEEEEEERRRMSPPTSSQLCGFSRGQRAPSVSAQLSTSQIILVVDYSGPAPTRESLSIHIRQSHIICRPIYQRQ